ncbi:protease modulator HflC [Planctomycetales bacterium ZRK34]|nr:protease modulator HflC [Planctomycetales bacterium ZRK34]
MKYRFTFLLGLLLAAMLIFYMVTYQVAFNEAVVVTTFGKAGDNAVHRGDSTDTGPLGNLHMRWPYPVQRLHSYDLRVQVMEERLEEQNTLDRQSVIASTFVAWRITDPLAFFKAVGTKENAEQKVRSKLRDARSILGEYTFDDLTNTDAARLKLDEVETRIRQQLQQQVADQGFGIEIESVGLRRLELPQSVSEKVFARMRKTRERLAERARSEGNAAANTIVADAENAAKRIMAFAEARAQALRAQGDAAASEYYATFKQNEQFAIFLRLLDTASDVFKHNTTFVIDAKEGIFQDLFQAPAAGAAPANGGN